MTLHDAIGETHETEGLDDQGPAAHEVAYDETTQNGFDLWNAAMLRVNRMVLNQNAGTRRKKNLNGISEAPKSH